MASYPEFGPTAICELQGNEAFRRRAFFGVIRGANAELHPAFVVRRQDGFHLRKVEGGQDEREKTSSCLFRFFRCDYASL